MRDRLEHRRPVDTKGVVRPMDQPIYPQGGLRVLRGNLAPRRRSHQAIAAAPSLQVHTGRAVVFDSVGDMAARIDSPDLVVDADSVLVLRAMRGPRGAPGMPEAGYIPDSEEARRAAASKTSFASRMRA